MPFLSNLIEKVKISSKSKTTYLNEKKSGQCKETAQGLCNYMN